MAFTAYIFQEDYDRLKTLEFPHAIQQQKGGSLFGQWTSTGNPVIHRALSFGQSQGERGEVARSLYEGFRVCHIGEWRPVETFTPDTQAREGRERLVRGGEPTLVRFLVLDVSRTEIVPFLLNRQTNRHEKGILEKLPGKNPFNKRESFEEPMPRRDHGYRDNPVLRYPAGQPNVPRHAPREAPQFQHAFTSGVQWYSGDEGNTKLQKVVASFQEIALGRDVAMSRDTATQDISLSFTDNRRRKKWEIKFPPDFPRVGALVIENPGARHQNSQRQGTSDKASKAVKNIISSIQNSTFM